MQAKLMEILMEFWHVLGEMAPYLLLGFLFAGILYVYVPTSFVEKHLGGRGLLSIFKAAAFGVPLPLCSCGVIPVAASLRRSGANRGATTAFLISTPQTGVDSILVTYSLLGIVFAVFRPLMALINGIIGGYIVDTFVKDNETKSGDKSGILKSDGCAGACCGSDSVKTSKFKTAMKYGFIDLPRDIGRALLVGLLIAGLISAFVPDDYFANVLGGGFVSMLIMMLAGIPVYVCDTASVPVAWALIEAGVSPGATLVFLMAGSATNAATVTVIWRTMGKQTVYIYLGTVAIAALLSGLLLNSIFTYTGTTAHPSMHWMIPHWFTNLSSIVLLGILGYVLFTKPHTEEIPIDNNDKETMKIKVSGMTCTHCQNAVRKAILSTKGVENASVDLKGGTATIYGKNFDFNEIKKAIEELGYTVEGKL